MAVGIKSPVLYNYKISGYAFVETAGPAIPTDDQNDYGGAGRLTGTPDIFSVSDGRSFDTIAEEYLDAQTYHALLNRGSQPGENTSEQWAALARKYGLGTAS